MESPQDQPRHAPCPAELGRQIPLSATSSPPGPPAPVGVGLAGLPF